MKTLSLALLSLFAAPALAADSDKPRHHAEVVCYIGKLDSGSFCLSKATQPSDPAAKNGSLKCGTPGKVSLIEWSFVGQRKGMDVYRFSRRFPYGNPEPPATTTEVQFAGKRLIVFIDTFQVIVIQPPKT